MRAKGIKNLVTREGIMAARDILDSREYCDTLIERAKTGSIPPIIEALLWHYAYGPPKAQHEAIVAPAANAAKIAQLATGELAGRADALAQAIRASSRSHQKALVEVPAPAASISDAAQERRDELPSIEDGRPAKAVASSRWQRNRIKGQNGDAVPTVIEAEIVKA